MFLLFVSMFPLKEEWRRRRMVPMELLQRRLNICNSEVPSLSQTPNWKGDGRNSMTRSLVHATPLQSVHATRCTLLPLTNAITTPLSIFFVSVLSFIIIYYLHLCLLFPFYLFFFGSFFYNNLLFTSLPSFPFLSFLSFCCWFFCNNLLFSISPLPFLSFFVRSFIIIYYLRLSHFP